MRMRKSFNKQQKKKKKKKHQVKEKPPEIKRIIGKYPVFLLVLDWLCTT